MAFQQVIYKLVMAFYFSNKDDNINKYQNRFINSISQNEGSVFKGVSNKRAEK